MQRELIHQKYRALRHSLDERSRRLWAATEAQAVGYGGASLGARATGISRSTIMRGLREVRRGARLAAGRIRRPGGGRKPATTTDPRLRAALDRLVEPTSRGDPHSPLRWTCRSTRALARGLEAQGHQVSDWLVRQLLHHAGYSLQANHKMLEGARHPDRDAQFRYIQAGVTAQLRRRQPAISSRYQEERGGGPLQEWRTGMAAAGAAGAGARARLRGARQGQGHSVWRV